MMSYCKIPKISPGAYIFQRPFLRGLFLEGLIFRGAYVWSEICVSRSIGLAYSWKEIITVFALFCFVFEGNFQVQAPVRACIRRGDLMEGFLRYRIGGPIFGGAYFRNLTEYGLQILCIISTQLLSSLPFASFFVDLHYLSL